MSAFEDVSVDVLRDAGSLMAADQSAAFESEITWDEEAVTRDSLVMTAKAIGLDPRVYLRDVMLRVAHETDVAKLTPHGWREHFQAEVEAEREAALAHFAGR